MAGNESQKQLLTLIRDYSTEKSQTERRIANQKKRVAELRSELETVNYELEKEKRVKETTEQEIKGYEVEMSMNDSSIHALEARIAVTNHEVSAVGAELEALKTEECLLRDGFIDKMTELNAQIRKFHELLDSTINTDNSNRGTSTGGAFSRHDQDAQKAAVVLENKLQEIALHTNHEEQQLNSEQLIHDQVQQELISSEKIAMLLDSVVKESMELQELSRQTSALEGKCAALGDELQKRFLCPNCHRDNSEELPYSQIIDSQMTDSQMTDSQMTDSQMTGSQMD